MNFGLSSKETIEEFYSVLLFLFCFSLNFYYLFSLLSFQIINIMFYNFIVLVKNARFEYKKKMKIMFEMLLEN